MNHFTTDELAVPKIVDRSTFHAELDALRAREKAHTKRGPVTLLDVFEGRRMPLAYYRAQGAQRCATFN